MNLSTLRDELDWLDNVELRFGWTPELEAERRQLLREVDDAEREGQIVVRIVS